MCCKKTSWVTFWKKKCLYSTYSSFLLINICNQGRTLCSPCTLPYTLSLKPSGIWHYVVWSSEEAAPSCFYPEVGSSTFIWNTGTYHANNTVSHPRSWSNNKHCNKLSFHYIQMIQNRHIAVKYSHFFLKTLYKCCVSDNIHFSVLPVFCS